MNPPKNIRTSLTNNDQDLEVVWTHNDDTQASGFQLQFIKRRLPGADASALIPLTPLTINIKAQKNQEVTKLITQVDIDNANLPPAKNLHSDHHAWVRVKTEGQIEEWGKQFIWEVQFVIALVIAGKSLFLYAQWKSGTNLANLQFIGILEGVFNVGRLIEGGLGSLGLQLPDHVSNDLPGLEFHHTLISIEPKERYLLQTRALASFPNPFDIDGNSLEITDLILFLERKTANNETQNTLYLEGGFKLGESPPPAKVFIGMNKDGWVIGLEISAPERESTGPILPGIPDNSSIIEDEEIEPFGIEPSLVFNQDFLPVTLTDEKILDFLPQFKPAGEDLPIRIYHAGADQSGETFTLKIDAISGRDESAINNSPFRSGWNIDQLLISFLDKDFLVSISVTKDTNWLFFLFAQIRPIDFGFVTLTFPRNIEPGDFSNQDDLLGGPILKVSTVDNSIKFASSIGIFVDATQLENEIQDIVGLDLDEVLPNVGTLLQSTLEIIFGYEDSKENLNNIEKQTQEFSGDISLEIDKYFSGNFSTESVHLASNLAGFVGDIELPENIDFSKNFPGPDEKLELGCSVSRNRIKKNSKWGRWSKWKFRIDNVPVPKEISDLIQVVNAMLDQLKRSGKACEKALEPLVGEMLDAAEDALFTTRFDLSLNPFSGADRTFVVEVGGTYTISTPGENPILDIATIEFGEPLDLTLKIPDGMEPNFGGLLCTIGINILENIANLFEALIENVDAFAKIMAIYMAKAASKEAIKRALIAAACKLWDELKKFLERLLGKVLADIAAFVAAIAAAGLLALITITNAFLDFLSSLFEEDDQIATDIEGIISEFRDNPQIAFGIQDRITPEITLDFDLTAGNEMVFVRWDSPAQILPEDMDGISLRLRINQGTNEIINPLPIDQFSIVGSLQFNNGDGTIPFIPGEKYTVTLEATYSFSDEVALDQDDGALEGVPAPGLFTTLDSDSLTLPDLLQPPNIEFDLPDITIDPIEIPLQHEIESVENGPILNSYQFAFFENENETQIEEGVTPVFTLHSDAPIDTAQIPVAQITPTLTSDKKYFVRVRAIADHPVFNSPFSVSIPLEFSFGVGQMIIGHNDVRRFTVGRSETDTEDTHLGDEL